MSEATDSTRYRFLQRLASGGMAELYVGEAIAPGGVKKRVALKRVQPRHSDNQGFLEMFLEEARLASTLQHPNIVQTYDVIVRNGEHILVMELLEGCDLAKFRTLLAETRTAFTLGQILYVVERTLSALHYAHERTDHEGNPREITHRDVSPHNVFVTYSGSIKLIDFGIASAASELDRGTSGVIKGKVHYMSPEQCEGVGVDRRTDVYAAGVMLYRLLTSKVPHRGKNPYDTMRAIIHETPVPPSTHIPALDDAIDQVVMRAIAKNPDDRYQTAREMQQAVAELMKSRGLFVTDVDFAGLVEGVLGVPERSRYVSEPDADVPSDLVLAEEVERSAGPRVLVSTESAVLERVEGVQRLQLQGAIDERLQIDAIVEHLSGELLVDSEHVTRVSSFGIRSLMGLFDGARGRTTAVYHARVSVPFVQQISMIRGLLGGGTVVSFYLPYVDPVLGTEFVELVAGEEGQRALHELEPPKRTCPDAAGREAEFDEDPESYFTFGKQFDAHPPAHIAAAIKASQDGARAKQVEKAINEEGVVVSIRRPITAGYRWSRLLRGSEGVLTLDLKHVPYTEPDGLGALMEAVTAVIGDLRGLRLSEAPVAAAAAFLKSEATSVLLLDVTVRVSAACVACSTPRRVGVSHTHWRQLKLSPTLPGELCPRCEGKLALVGEPPDLPDLQVIRSVQGEASSVESTQVDDAAPTDSHLVANVRSTGVNRSAIFLAVTVLALLGAVAVFLVAAKDFYE